MKILLLEDDIILNDTISSYLEFTGHDVQSCDDGERAIQVIDTLDASAFELYIIDINTPSVSGLEVVKYIRKKDLSVPIIMITASIELENFKTAYQNGCDDYIKKPFYLEELEIRINKLLKKSLEKQTVIKISDRISYDLDYEELVIDGVVKRLRKKEKRLLTLFLHNINKTLPLSKIESYVWENEIKDTYPVRQLVNDLRHVFDNGETFIFADRGIGYKFEIKN